MNFNSGKAPTGHNAPKEHPQTGAPRDAESLSDHISTSNGQGVDFQPERLDLRARTVEF